MNLKKLPPEEKPRERLLKIMERIMYRIMN